MCTAVHRILKDMTHYSKKSTQRWGKKDATSTICFSRIHELHSKVEKVHIERCVK